VPGRRIKFLRRFGHRGSVLVGFAVTCFAYGSGILEGYRPTFTEAYHVSLPAFALVFYAVAVGATVGALTGRDALPYAAGVAWTAAWGMLITTHWTQPHGWTAAVSWFGICLGLLLSSAWPNAPHSSRIAQPEPPALRELVGDDS
jgi:hypothetical protein